MKKAGCCRATDMKQVVKRAYGKRWSKEESCCEGPDLLSKAHEALVKQLSPKKGMNVLDVGCGTGDTTLHIAQKVGPTGRAVGIDFTKEGIAKAKQKARKMRLDGVAKFELAEAERLPFEDETFDAVISECVVCLTPDKQQVLNEKTRVLKPGGRIIMHDVIRWAPMPQAIQTNPRLYCGCIGGAVTMDDYRAMMKKAGLTKVKAVDYSGETRKLLSAGILSTALDLTGKGRAFEEIVDFVKNDGIGYALFVGTKTEN